jgi:hypothetical protein
MEDTQCRDCLNVQSTTTGAIVKRTGATSSGLSGLPAAPKSLFAVESTSTDHFLVAAAGNVTATTGASTSGASSDYWSFVEATPQDGQGPVFLSNGTQSLAYDGSSFVPWTMDSSSTLGSSGASVPAGKFLEIHESRIVVAGTADPSAIYWSEVQVGVGTLPCRWMIENQQLFDPKDGDEITGLGKVGSNLLVFKKHKVFVVYDISTGASRRLSTNVGCIAPRSIVETPLGTMFLSDHGVYVTNGSTVELVSDVITPTLQGFTNKTTATAVLHENHYYLSFPDEVNSAGAAPILDYDVVLRSWWRHAIGPAGSQVVYDFAVRFNGSTPELYGAVAGDIGRLFVPNTYSDFGSGYSWKWVGPWHAPSYARRRMVWQYPAVRKRMKAIRVDGIGKVSLAISKDYQDVASTVTPQAADGTPRTSLFQIAKNTTFGSATPDGTFFGDFDGSTTPATPTGPTTFTDVSVIDQARIWGQGVGRSWSMTFSDDPSDLVVPAAALIENYTLYLQERSQ